MTLTYTEKRGVTRIVAPDPAIAITSTPMAATRMSVVSSAWPEVSNRGRSCPAKMPRLGELPSSWRPRSSPPATRPTSAFTSASQTASFSSTSILDSSLFDLPLIIP